MRAVKAASTFFRIAPDKILSASLSRESSPNTARFSFCKRFQLKAQARFQLVNFLVLTQLTNLIKYHHPSHTHTNTLLEQDITYHLYTSLYLEFQTSPRSGAFLDDMAAKV